MTASFTSTALQQRSTSSGQVEKTWANGCPTAFEALKLTSRRAAELRSMTRLCASRTIAASLILSITISRATGTISNNRKRTRLWAKIRLEMRKAKGVRSRWGNGFKPDVVTILATQGANIAMSRLAPCIQKRWEKRATVRMDEQRMKAPNSTPRQQIMGRAVYCQSF